MSKEEGRREIVYQMTMTAARKMLVDGLISRDKYGEFESRMRVKYKPLFGELFSNINLI